MFIYFQEADADNYADAEADDKVTGISKISNISLNLTPSSFKDAIVNIHLFA